MRKIILPLFLLLSACSSGEYGTWRKDAIAQCDAKTDPVAKRTCLDQVDAVDRAHTPGGYAPPTPKS